MERWNWHSPLGRGRAAESSLGITSPEQTTQPSDTDSEAPGPSHFLSSLRAQFSEATTEGRHLRKLSSPAPGGTGFGKALRLSNYPAFLLLLLLLLRELGRLGAPSSCIGLPNAPSLREPCPRSLVSHLTHSRSSLSSPNLTYLGRTASLLPQAPTKENGDINPRLGAITVLFPLTNRAPLASSALSAAAPCLPFSIPPTSFLPTQPNSYTRSLTL